jgi:hypothetical protein
MEFKDYTKIIVIKKPESGILAEVLEKIKDKVLFPKEVERARKILQNAKWNVKDKS